MTGPLVIVGDTLLDVDLQGRPTRLTPDAPVPVLEDLEEHARPGGAGLAALMAAAGAAEVVLVTALGDDEAGARVRGLLDGVDVRALPYDGPTPVKKRVRARGQSLLRLDEGTAGGRPGEPDDAIADVLRLASAVLVSDYGRGVAGVTALRAWIAALPQRVPVVWDPHPRGATPMPGARLATPNDEEAATFGDRLGVPGGGGALVAVDRRARALLEAWRAQAVAVTLGERGALLTYGDGAPMVVPPPLVTAVDTCGAGDRFAVSAALALAAGSVTAEAVQAAVHDAAAYVASGGPASLTTGVQSPASPRDGTPVEQRARAIAARGGVVVATGGCFDLLHAGHVASLRAARGLGDWLVVCVNSDDSVRRLKGPGRPLVPQADRVRVLEALECVDAVVVFDEDTPVEVLRRLRPQIWAKGGDYAGRDVPEAAVLREWDGQAVVLPYLEGRSTTRLARTVADRAAATPKDRTQHDRTHHDRTQEVSR
jgi:rfaE bifunctional protein nucleotidyltransferase chain/domain/rfaE bifunctional protein kinase chain/domain